MSPRSLKSARASRRSSMSRPDAPEIEPRSVAGVGMFERRKSNFRFIPYAQAPVATAGSWRDQGDCLLGEGVGARFELPVPALTEAAAVLVSHDWSGLIAYQFEDEEPNYVDLFTWYSWHRVIVLPRRRREGRWVFTVVGANPASTGTQMGLFGVLMEKTGSTR